jgi:hypothetical protein
MRASGESSALECMWIYAAYALRSRIAAFDGPMIGRPRLFAKRCAILFPSSARALWHRLACKRCRYEAICVTDVVGGLTELLVSDPARMSGTKSLLLGRFLERHARASEAVARTARTAFM